MLPPPSQLLGIGRFFNWYPGQELVVSQALSWYYDSDPNRYRPPSVNKEGNFMPVMVGDDTSAPSVRFLGLSVPTGAGKSLVAILLAKLTNSRIIILTATKGLQQQIMSDFACLGVINAVGQNNFMCVTVPELRVDEAPCHEGMSCSLRDSGCAYYDQLRHAISAKIVVTNYAYYLAQTRFSSGLGAVDLLVLDESHLAFSALENHLSVTLSRLELEPLGIRLLRQEQPWANWQSWAKESLPLAESVLRDLESEAKSKRQANDFVSSYLSRQLRTVRAAVRNLSTMASASDRWVVSPYHHGWQFVPVWVYDYGNILFRDVPKVMLMSAILSEKTMDSIGVDPAPNRQFISVGSSFPPANTPIYHIPTVRVNRSTSDMNLKLWVARIDQIIERRLDRKGIIFTVSYQRRDSLIRQSRFADIMVSHSTRDVVVAVRKFKEMDAPAVLVSPSITSGFDLPAEEFNIRYIIVGKIPYPDTSDPAIVARQEEDKSWSSFMAADTLVQECGRLTRSQSDKAEVLICDDNWKWFYGRYKNFMPKWFQERVRGSLQSVPGPMI